MPSPIHPASLLHPASHSPALLDLVHLKISQPVINYLVDAVADTVNYAIGRPSSSSPALPHHLKHASFTAFVATVIQRAEITTPVILVTLVYIDRAKPHLHIALEQWALERVFLGALISASKYLNDSTLKNVHWALCTGVFGKRDIGRIEREFLDVLNFQLGVTEADILAHHDGLSVSLAARSHRYLTPHLIRSSVQPAHPRHHHRRPDVVPGLSPSSSQPSSSSGDSSPRTPPSPADSRRPSARTTFPVQAPTRPSSPSGAKKALHMSTLDLLRAFPIPMPPQDAQFPSTLHHHHSAILPPPSQMQLCA